MGISTPAVTMPTYARPQGGFASYSPPASPSGLVVTPSSNANALAWVSNSTNETGFQVERAASASGPFTVIATKGAGVTTHSDSGLSTGSYYYRVTALRSVQSSGYTSVVVGVIAPPIVAPTLSAPSMTSSGAIIASTGGSGYATLILRYRIAGAGAWSGSTNDTSSPYTYTGLAAGSYEFEVWPDGNQAYASNRVTGIVVSGSTYTPFYRWTTTGRTVGQPAEGNGWSFATYNGGPSVVYSSDILGPHGEALTGKVAVPTRGGGSGSYFGGYLVQGLGTSQSIVSGGALWFRMYYWFPTGFDFGNGGGDGWARTKFNNFKFTDDARFFVDIESVNGSQMFDSRYTATNLDPGGGYLGNFPIQRRVVAGQWLALQVHIHFGNSSTGYAETWVNDVYQGRVVNYIGESNYITIPAGQKLESIILGDYWNGGARAAQSFYVADAIATTQTPTTLDGGGRPYISPTVRATDF